MPTKTRLAKGLNKQVRVCSVEHTPVTSGGFDQTYKTLAVVWAKIRAISTSAAYFNLTYTRDKQIGEFVTHTFTFRNEPSIGMSAYGEDSILKAGHYIALPIGVKGSRLFKIRSVVDVEEKGVYLKVDTEETTYLPDDAKIVL
jgi:hypothetical protein